MKLTFGLHDYTEKHVDALSKFVENEAKAIAEHAEQVEAYERREGEGTWQRHGYPERLGIGADKAGVTPGMAASLAQRGIIERTGTAYRHSYHRSNPYALYRSTPRTVELLEAWTNFLQNEETTTQTVVDEIQKRRGDGMTREERKTLNTILARRKAVLQAQLRQREREIEIVIRDRILADKQAEIDAANKEIEAQNKEIDRQNSRIEQLAKSTMDKMQGMHERGLIDRVPRVDIERIKHIKLQPRHVSVKEEVGAELRRLREMKGLGQLTIEEQFLSLEEELLYGALKSDGALAFLDKVPTVDQALPSAQDAVKLLDAAK
jgi:hypothetical protein